MYVLMQLQSPTQSAKDAMEKLGLTPSLTDGKANEERDTMNPDHDVLFTRIAAWRANGYHGFTDDVARLIRIAATAGVTLTETEAMLLWREYSETFVLSWIPMDDLSDELVMDAMIQALT